MPALLYKINQDICSKCGLCKKDCPSGAVDINDGLYSINPQKCIRCGHCGAVCPVNAVSCDGEKLKDYIKPELTEEQAFHLVAGKRSVRNYKSDPIPSDILDRILELGSLTSTATNSMSVRASLFTEGQVTELTKGLCGVLLGVLKKINNPLGRSVIRMAGYKRYSKPAMLNAFESRMNAGLEGTEDPLFYQAPAVICLTYPKGDKSFGRTNTALAGQSIMLYAHSLGIESCMIGFAEMAGKGKKGRASLKVPQDRRIGLIFTLGYGKTEYRQLPKRKSLV